MEELTLSVAGMTALVQHQFRSAREYFRDYLTDAHAEIQLCITEEDRLREQQMLDAEADAEGLRRREFTPPFLERSAVQRKLAAQGLSRDILLFHGSTVAVDGKAYLFTARCGGGKSTHTRLWRELFGEHAMMVNDDRAFLEFSPAGVLAYGSPWSGKHGLDTNVCVPLAGICILRKGGENAICKAPAADVLPLLLEQAYLPEESFREQAFALTSRLANSVPLWQMTCTKDLSAARMAYYAMSGNE